MKTVHTFATVLVLGLVACGQDPSFIDKNSVMGKSSNSSSTNGNGPDGTGGVSDNPSDGSGSNPGTGSGSSGADAQGNAGGDGTVGGNGNNGTGTGSGGGDVVDIPGAKDSDLGALRRCMAQWPNTFNGTVNNYRRIAASVSVGGIGNPINDTQQTDEPFLILVDAGVNVGGAPTYNLLNKNGYYCMKVNVNVQTALTINLHCNARLADARVSVNVGSQQNEATAAIGVSVLSSVQVNPVRPAGDQCIR